MASLFSFVARQAAADCGCRDSIIYAIGYTSATQENGKGRVFGFMLSLPRKSSFIRSGGVQSLPRMLPLAYTTAWSLINIKCCLGRFPPGRLSRVGAMILDRDKLLGDCGIVTDMMCTYSPTWSLGSGSLLRHQACPVRSQLSLGQLESLCDAHATAITHTRPRQKCRPLERWLEFSLRTIPYRQCPGCMVQTDRHMKDVSKVSLLPNVAVGQIASSPVFQSCIVSILSVRRRDATCHDRKQVDRSLGATRGSRYTEGGCHRPRIGAAFFALQLIPRDHPRL